MRSLATIAVLLGLSCPVWASDATLQLVRAGFASGMIASSAGEFVLNASSGEPATGPVTAGDLSVVGGFWGGKPKACGLDVDEDGRVDVATDLVYIARRLEGLSPVPSAFRVIDATIPPDDVIADAVDALGTSLDVDERGGVDVDTDLLYVARNLLGLSPVPASFRVSDPTIPSDAALASRIAGLCTE